jgi:hypothetical protein
MTNKISYDEDGNTIVPDIDLQDIANALNLITVAIKRGTYERRELRDVLDTTDKLETYVSYHAPAAASQHAHKCKTY